MLINELTVRGLLSFGPDTPPLRLQPLNVLIGPNGSGKSNLVEALSLLRSAATNLSNPIRGTGGGAAEWIWKGKPQGSARLEAGVRHPDETQYLRHSLALAIAASRLTVAEERIECPGIWKPGSGPSVYDFNGGTSARVAAFDGPLFDAPPFTDDRLALIQLENVRDDQSVLSQRKEPRVYPQLSYLSEAYADIRIYRDWHFGRSAIFRTPQPADMPGDRLEEDFSNLGLFLNHLRGVPKAKQQIVERLRDLYDGLDDFDVRVKGGTVEVFLTEGDFVIPASRLSDGTLRYLCLLAILCDPRPPRLVCIEEPELGLHPDLIPKIADLLQEASERTQLIVTTHSDVLVDALSDRPESVVVVEKHDGATQMTRLENASELQDLLKQYRLGELWTRGEIGGVRW